MSNASRTRYLVPALALTLATACESPQDNFVEENLAQEDEGFRSGRSTRGGGTGGILLNTNNMGEWEFTELPLDGTFHRDVKLLGVENAAFDYGGGRPSWEHDDTVSPVGIDTVGSTGVFDLHVDNSHMLTGTTTDGQFLQHGDFHNSLWTIQVDPAYIPDLDAAGVTHDGGGVVELRLEVGWYHPDGIAPVPPGLGEDGDEHWVAGTDSAPTYTFIYEKFGQEHSTCSTALAPGASFVEAALYNDVVIDESNGEVTYEEDMLQIACLEGAIGKAGAIWGYWPDDMDDPSTLSPGDVRENFETVTRMIRADYCGDGQSWTAPGTGVQVFDVFAHTPATSHITDYGTMRPGVEAVWAPGGAVCLDDERVSGLRPACGLTPCGRKWPAFGMLNDPMHPSIFVTRTTWSLEPNI